MAGLWTHRNDCNRQTATSLALFFCFANIALIILCWRGENDEDEHMPVWNRVDGPLYDDRKTGSPPRFRSDLLGMAYGERRRFVVTATTLCSHPAQSGDASTGLSGVG